MNRLFRLAMIFSLALAMFPLSGCGGSDHSSDPVSEEEEAPQLTEAQEDACAEAAQVASELGNLAYVIAPMVETSSSPDVALQTFSARRSPTARAAQFEPSAVQENLEASFGPGVQVELLSDDPLQLRVTFDAVETSRGTPINGYFEVTVLEEGDVFEFRFFGLQIGNKKISGDLTVSKQTDGGGYDLLGENLTIEWATRQQRLVISLHDFEMTVGSDDTITTNGEATIETEDRTLDLTCNDLVVSRTEPYPTGEVLITVDDLEIVLIFDGTSKVQIKVGEWLSWKIHLPEAIIELILGRHLGPVRAVSFSPQNDFVASGGGEGHIKIWSVGSRRLYRPIVAFENAVYAVSYSPDGSMLAAGGDDGVLKVFLTENYAAMASWELGSPINGIAWSPDQTMVATALEDSTVRILRLQESDLLPLKVLEGHRGWVGSVVWSPDGKVIATGGADKDIRIWDVSRGADQATLAYKLEGHDTEVTGLDFFPSGKLVSVGLGNNVAVWDVEAGQRLENGSLPDDTTILGFLCVTAASDNHWFVAGSSDDDPVVRWWYPHDAGFQVLTAFESVQANGDDTNSLDLSPNMAYLASGSTTGYVKLFRGFHWGLDVEDEQPALVPQSGRKVVTRE